MQIVLHRKIKLNSRLIKYFKFAMVWMEDIWKRYDIVEDSSNKATDLYLQKIFL